ncbi:MAG: hypothetical protein GW913_07560, partial [Myxococcales bacterium]|nr:hypothetical protein [Myxococcales bacterium]
ELEAAQADALKTAADAHGKELALLGRKLAETERSLEEGMQNAARLSEQKAELETQLTETQEARDLANAQLAAARAQVDELSTEGKAKDGKIAELEAARASLEAARDRTQAKLDSDEALLERARRAMTIGLGLLEDQRQNAVAEAEAE